MKITSSIIALILVAMLATNSWATSNLNLSKSNVNRVRDFPNAAVTTASINITGPGDTETVYTTPASGDFILTEFCASLQPDGGVLLSAAGLGGIAQTGPTTSCFTFTPGLSIPKGSLVSCSTASGASPGSYFCMISGVQTAK
jgi:hypothetical protein